MKIRAFASAVLLAFGGSVASASIAPVIPPITIGDKTFSDISISGNVDPSTIQIVRAPGSDIGLEFQHAWSSTNGNNEDTVVSYHVHVNDPNRSIIAVGLHFDGTTNIMNTDLLTAATVTETVYDNSFNQIGKLTVFNAGPNFPLLDRDSATLMVAPTKDLNLTKDIQVNSSVNLVPEFKTLVFVPLTGGGTSTISLVDNTFAQTSAVPLPPAALTALSTLGLGAFAPIRRKVRGLLFA